MRLSRPGAALVAALALPATLLLAPAAAADPVSSTVSRHHDAGGRPVGTLGTGAAVTSALRSLNVTPSTATGICTGVYDAGTGNTTYTDTRPVTLEIAGFDPESLTVAGTAQKAAALVITSDDCWGADSVEMLVRNTTTNATRLVPLEIADYLETPDFYLDLWEGDLSFTNYDKGTWVVDEVRYVDVSGAATFDVADNVVSDDTVLGAPVTATDVPSFALDVAAATSMKVDGTPEPVAYRSNVKVNVSSFKAQGNAWVTHGYARVRIEYCPPGRGQWRLLQYVNTNRYGLGSYSFVASVKGTWKLRGVYYGAPGYAKSISAVDEVLAR
jgi:hypothetical protein